MIFKRRSYATGAEGDNRMKAQLSNSKRVPNRARSAGSHERLVMRPGLKVWTETTSGSPILCTVIEADWLIEGEWLLNSPAHVYAIQRHHSECQAA